MGISNLQGTPWHIEQMHRKDGDERRHRSRCMFYNPITKQCKDHWKCNGSRYCRDYEPLSGEEYKQRQEDTAESKRLLAKGYTEKEIANLLAQKKKQDLNKKVILQKPTEIKEKVDKKNTLVSENVPYLVGKYIYHKGYGKGLVIEQTKESIVVNYKGIEKTQKLSMLIKNKIIEY